MENLGAILPFKPFEAQIGQEYDGHFSATYGF